MTDDLAAFNQPISILTAPHPATRRAAAFLAEVFAADSRNVCFSLITDDRVLDARAPAIYLRAGVNDALDLAVTADLHGPSPFRAACALLADLDDHWHGVPRLSLEEVIDRPLDAIRYVARQFGLTPAEPVLAAADQLITALRNEVAPFLHALPFLAAVERRERAMAWTDRGVPSLSRMEEVFALVRSDAPHHMLVVSRSGASPSPELMARASEWRLNHVELACGGIELPTPTDQLGLIYFDHIHGEGCGDLLDRLMDQLAPGGVLCGEERTDTMAQAAVAQITKAGEPYQLIFVLSGSKWCAIPPAWWR